MLAGSSNWILRWRPRTRLIKGSVARSATSFHSMAPLHTKDAPALFKAVVVSSMRRRRTKETGDCSISLSLSSYLKFGRCSESTITRSRLGARGLEKSSLSPAGRAGCVCSSLTMSTRLWLRNFSEMTSARGVTKLSACFSSWSRYAGLMLT